MFCEFCGKPIDDNARVCPHCGEPVADDIFERAGKPSAAAGAASVGNAVNTGNTIGMEQPHVEQPYMEQPHQEQPYIEQPYVEQPYQEQPYQEQPYAQNPYAEEPFMGAGNPGGNAGFAPNPNGGAMPYGQQQADPRVNQAAVRTVGNRIRDLILAEGEIVVRQYKCADFAKAAGYLTVTNKRVMFHAVGDNSRMTQEVGLPSVSGLRSYYGTNYDIKKIVIGILIGIVGIIAMVSSGTLFPYGGGGAFIGLGFLLLLVGALFVFLGIERSFLIAVYAKDVTKSPIVVGQGPTSLVGNSALYAFNTIRNHETDVMLNELGAMIQDLQTLGDYAIEKWQRKSDFNSLPTL